MQCFFRASPRVLMWAIMHLDTWSVGHLGGFSSRQSGGGTRAAWMQRIVAHRGLVLTAYLRYRQDRANENMRKDQIYDVFNPASEAWDSGPQNKIWQILRRARVSVSECMTPHSFN